MPKKPATYRPCRHPRPEARANPHRHLLWTARFRTFRTWLLHLRPVCERCRRKPAGQVHHRRKLAEHPEDLCDQEQCECLCVSCHSRATAAGE